MKIFYFYLFALSALHMAQPIETQNEETATTYRQLRRNDGDAKEKVRDSRGKKNHENDLAEDEDNSKVKNRSDEDQKEVKKKSKTEIQENDDEAEQKILNEGNHQKKKEKEKSKASFDGKERPDGDDKLKTRDSRQQKHHQDTEATSAIQKSEANQNKTQPMIAVQEIVGAEKHRKRDKAKGDNTSAEEKDGNDEIVKSEEESTSNGFKRGEVKKGGRSHFVNSNIKTAKRKQNNFESKAEKPHANLGLKVGSRTSVQKQHKNGLKNSVARKSPRSHLKTQGSINPRKKESRKNRTSSGAMHVKSRTQEPKSLKL